MTIGQKLDNLLDNLWDWHISRNYYSFYMYFKAIHLIKNGNIEKLSWEHIVHQLGLRMSREEMTYIIKLYYR